MELRPKIIFMRHQGRKFPTVVTDAADGFAVLAPFLRWSKADIVRHGDELGVPFADTWSCYKGGDVHCGTCGTCVERIEAFRRNPPPADWSGVFAYETK